MTREHLACAVWCRCDVTLNTDTDESVGSGGDVCACKPCDRSRNEGTRGARAFSSRPGPLSYLVAVREGPNGTSSIRAHAWQHAW